MTAPTLELRDYQVAARRALYGRWKRGGPGWRRSMLAVPTGCGKTAIGLSVAAHAIDRGHRVAWLAHRTELLDQPLRTLATYWPALRRRAGIVKAERDEAGADLVFASVDTLAGANRRQAVADAGSLRLIVVDEAHHCIDGNRWGTVLDALEDACDQPPLVLGLTATPDRADGKPLGERWRVAYSYPIQAALDAGWLVSPSFTVDRLDVDLSDVTVRSSGDYDDRALADALISAGMVDHTAEAMDKHAKGRRCVVFTVTIDQADRTAAALRHRGWRAATLSGHTPEAERAGILRDLGAGTIDAVCNAAVLTEGFDEPTVDCVVLARPTRSKPLYIQIVGRGLRLAPGKSDCLVLDLAGASEEHDLVSAGALTEHGEGRDDDDRAATGGGAGGGLYAGLVAKRDRLVYNWVPVPAITGRAYALGAGNEGRLALVYDPEADGWRPLVLRTAKQADERGGARVEPLVTGTVPLALAQSLGEDFARRANAGTLARRSSKWRTQPTSAKQAALCARLGLSEPATKGEAEGLLTAAFTGKDLVRLGYAARVERPAGHQLELV